jgi:protein transport protein SEC24
MELAKSSNGGVFYYPDFNSRTHGLKFTNELYHALTRQTAWESVFRVRISNGWKEVISMGNLTIKHKTKDLIIGPTMDQDKVYVYEIEKDELWKSSNP